MPNMLLFLMQFKDHTENSQNIVNGSTQNFSLLGQYEVLPNFLKSHLDSILLFHLITN